LYSTFFLAHLSLCRGAASVVRQLFPLNNFFSRTTEPNATKLGRKYHWAWGFRFVKIKGHDLQVAPLGAKRGQIWQIFKNLLLENYKRQSFDISH